MAKREFLQLAHVFDPAKHGTAGWYMSVKLDGMRAWWDGGVTRGMLTREVPWANTAKDFIKLIPPRASGLWSRYGKPIMAPDWFLDRLPKIPADGELWGGEGQFQRTMSTVKQLVPDDRWRQINYLIFDFPTHQQVLSNGEIKVKGKFEKKLQGIQYWLKDRGVKLSFEQKPFYQIVNDRHNLHEPNDYCHFHTQTLLPPNRADALAEMNRRLAQVLEQNGEGLILRNPSSVWTPARMYSLLKYKPSNDSEGIITGYTWGKETDLGSKLLGKMGAMFVLWQGKEFKLSGFTDAEREMVGPDVLNEGIKYEGDFVKLPYYNPMFPVGSMVTFSYRELTDDGKPKEARYLRRYEE